jgi:hypothetical protein
MGTTRSENLAYFTSLASRPISSALTGRRLTQQGPEWNTDGKVPESVKVMNENVETDLGLDEGILLGRVLIRWGLDAKITSNQLKGTLETLPNGDEVLVPNEQANQAILDGFRHGGPNVRRSNLNPRPEASSCHCE